MDVTLILSTLAQVMQGPVGVAFSLTLLGAIVVGHLREERHREQVRRELPMRSDNLPRELLIPVVQNDPDLIARADITNRMAHLASEERWSDIAAEIADWERRLEATPGGARNHEIAVTACLAPLRALLDDTPRRDFSALAPAEAEAARFVARHRQNPDDPILAVMAARAHLMLADTCNADYWPEALRRTAWRQMAHHYLRRKDLSTGGHLCCFAG